MQLQDNEEEKLPVVDMEGHVIGSASRGECHNGSMLLHPVVHLHVTDSAGRLCLQLRPSWKKVQPGKWDTAVGGMWIMERRLMPLCCARLTKKSA